MECSALEADKRADVHNQGHYYVAIAELGYDLFSALLKGSADGFGDRFLDIIETALSAGDPDTRNLVVVGLFESLQSQNYRRGPADLIEGRLGPVSLLAWSDLMEGWSGEGIRDVAAWRAATNASQL